MYMYRILRCFGLQFKKIAKCKLSSSIEGSSEFRKYMSCKLVCVLLYYLVVWCFVAPYVICSLYQVVIHSAACMLCVLSWCVFYHVV